MRNHEIHPDTVRRKFRQIFPGRDPKEILVRLEQLGALDGRPNHRRICLAVLKLHEEGVGDLSSLIETAKED